MITRHCISRKASKKLRVSFFEDIDLIPSEHWDAVVDGETHYLSRRYLRSLETSLSEEIDFRYILFYDDELIPVGVSAIQLHRFTGDDFDLSKLTERMGDVFPSRLLEHMDIRFMICGNAFSAGEHGYHFANHLDTETAMENLLDAIERIRREEDRTRNRISLFLLKDFWPDTLKQLEPMREAGFRPIQIDPNMVIRLSDEWTSYDQYLGDMTTKFRTKLKGVGNKSADILAKPLNAADIEFHQSRINSLYEAVVERAGYRFGTINAQTFAQFAHNLPESVRFTGYFLDDELIGFSSAFLDRDVLDANFVGIDYRFNVSHALYQRMLCDFVKTGIEEGCREIRLGRTAEEVKSCLGAEPISMTLFIKHRNHFTNTLLKPLIESIKPSSFELRKPFKAAVYESWTQ